MKCGKRALRERRVGVGHVWEVRTAVAVWEAGCEGER